MSASRRLSTLVLGGGIVGVCTARALQNRGEQVAVMDRIPIGEGCSHGNAGVLCTWSVEAAATPGFWKDLPGWTVDPLGPVSLKLAYLPRLLPWLMRFFAAANDARRAEAAEALFTLHNPTVDLYRQLLDGTGHESLVVDAEYIFASRSATKLRATNASFAERARYGATVVDYTPGELREVEPALSPEYLSAVSVKGQGRVTSPGRLTKVLGEQVVEHGGEFIGAEVKAVTPRDGGGAHVQTDNGAFEAERLVVAAGAWSHQWAAAFGIKVPLEGERGYHMHFANPGVTLNNSICDADRKFVASSMEGGVRCAGTSEFNALDAPPDWRRADVLKTLGRAMMPSLNVDDGERWMGRRPALPDTVPVVSETPGHRGVYFAFGHGHYGLTAAPMTGRIIAGLATGERLNTDVSAYSLDRYA